MTARIDLDAREALAERLVDDTAHALEALSVYLGLKLGLYQALNDLGAATEADVAATTGVAPVCPRMARAAGDRWLPRLQRPGPPAGAAPLPAARRPW